MLMPASPMSVPNLPMKPGLSALRTNSMCGASSQSMSMSRTWMMRGRPSENTVPATERSYSSVFTVKPDVALVGALLRARHLLDDDAAVARAPPRPRPC